MPLQFWGWTRLQVWQCFSTFLSHLSNWKHCRKTNSAFAVSFHCFFLCNSTKISQNFECSFHQLYFPPIHLLAGLHAVYMFKEIIDVFTEQFLVSYIPGMPNGLGSWKTLPTMWNSVCLHMSNGLVFWHDSVRLLLAWKVSSVWEEGPPGIAFSWQQSQ